MVNKQKDQKRVHKMNNKNAKRQKYKRTKRQRKSPILLCQDTFALLQSFKPYILCKRGCRKKYHHLL